MADAGLPRLSPQTGWPINWGLPCCGCGVDLDETDAAAVQVDFPDAPFLAFCGFKCLLIWTQYFSDGRMDEIRAWTDLVEPQRLAQAGRDG